MAARTNQKGFQKDLADFQSETERLISFAAKKVGETAFKTVIKYSPYPMNPGTGRRSDDSPHSRGSYVLSHRIGINAPSNEAPTVVPDGQVIIDADTQALAELDKLKQLPRYPSVFISNRCGHADQVEYGAWDWEGAKAPAYFTYMIASEILKKRLSSILKSAQNQFEKSGQ